MKHTETPLQMFEREISRLPLREKVDRLRRKINEVISERNNVKNELATQTDLIIDALLFDDKLAREQLIESLPAGKSHPLKEAQRAE